MHKHFYIRLNLFIMTQQKLKQINHLVNFIFISIMYRHGNVVDNVKNIKIFLVEP